MGVLIGIDLGTTHIKVAAFTLAGRLLALERGRTPVRTPRPGWAEHDPAAVWEQVAAGLRAVTGRIPAEAGPVRAVGVAGMAEAGLVVDLASRKARSPIIAWYDQRTAPFLEPWRPAERAAEALAATGVSPSAKASLLKLQWLQRHEPAVVAKGGRWLNTPDFVAFRLTGEAATDPTLAGRTMAYDIRRRRWHQAFIEEAGLDPDLFPPVASSTQAVGGVSAAAAAETGLPEKTPVTIAGHDHVVGATGVGAVEAGDVVDSIGTAETVVWALGGLPADPAAAGGYHFGCHTVEDMYYAMAGLSASGGTVDWFLARLAGFEGGQASLRYERLLETLAEAPAGPTQVLHLPFLRGSGPPQRDRQATGALIGLTEKVTPAVWMKAVLEGLACEFRRMLEGIPDAEPKPVTVIGGGARNPYWLAVKAAVINRRLIVPEIEEAVAWGAALQAGVGAGVWPDVQAGLAGLEAPKRMVEPNSEEAEAYDRWYREVYLPAIDQVKSVQRRMARFSAQALEAGVG